MTSRTLALRSLQFYLRSHLGTIAGAAIATAVLTGALLVGDSVRQSLRQTALARIGKIDHALASGDRLFLDSLDERLASSLPGATVVSALQFLGTVSTPHGTARANRAQITGVDDKFWALGNDPAPSTSLMNDSVWLNRRLANHLRVNTGDTVLLRVPRVFHLSRDAPLSPEEDATAALRMEVSRIVSDDEFGRFGLQASQVPPFNAFVPLQFLQDRVNATNQANLLLVASAARHPVLPAQNLDAALHGQFTLADAQLRWRRVSDTNFVELRTARVFLDGNISRVSMDLPAAPIFTYFVNELRHGERATPYSMVTASTGPLISHGMRDDEILINQWLADDLQARRGDQIHLTYYVMGLMRELVQQTNSFVVRAVVPMELPYSDPSLMPDFPGMTDADNCRDWDTGFPIDTEAIRDKDEAYWDEHRGTPKAFVTLAAGQKMWSNRFGNLTGMRYPAAAQEQVEKRLLARLAPKELGLVFQPIREQALAASAGAQDFGQLFIGFSFFLIAAALLLMALLFRFSLEQRGVEIGTLLALGYEPKRVRKLLLIEGLGLALIGSLIGIAGAVLYAKAMIYGLSTIWRDAVGASALNYFASPRTLIIGLVAGSVVALLTMWWSLRAEAKRSARELLAEGFDSEQGVSSAAQSTSARKRMRRNLAIASVSFAAALVTAGFSFLAQDGAGAQLFFTAGALLLISGLAFSAALIRRFEISSLVERLSLTGMGIRSVTRRASRSLATIILLACGAFLIASIGAFRLDATRNAGKRSSGTGGFELIAESAIPVVHNLNAQAGRDFFGLEPKELSDVSFVPLRVLEGEDASCLNLNRAQRPRLLGVNPEHLHQRRAFTFSRILKGAQKENPWLLLDRDFGPNVIPAIGDAASIQYALGKKLGDSLIYVDQHGSRFRVKLVAAVANSILQGNLVISEKHFVSRFPSEAGYRMFLVDAPSNRAAALRATLSKALQDVGLEVSRAQERLAAFNAVQNTYLGTFQLLGGLGLLLGSFGLGVVLLRNVFERRGEFALLLAVGFRKPALKWLVTSEHAALLLLGLIVGVLSAVIAVLPALLTPGAQLPYVQLALTLGGVLIFGLLWTLVAASLALRAPLLSALRNE